LPAHARIPRGKRTVATAAVGGDGRHAAESMVTGSEKWTANQALVIVRRVMAGAGGTCTVIGADAVAHTLITVGVTRLVLPGCSESKTWWPW
jgi:hypothetical protein